MDTQDKSFINTFMLVLGFLAAGAVVFYIVAHIVAAGHYSAMSSDPLRDRLLAERLAPVGQAYVGNVPASALQVASKSSGAAAEPQSPKEIWQGTCSACHATGVAGAPKIGDKQEWAKHIAKGLATLKDHAINGYHGPEGFMPPKGGNPSLTDEQVVAAMKYMIGQSGGDALLKKSGS
ncbi:MAG TPA: c-type cytochrome [Gammaproteobacteria bacterium]|nr:c-type cytochrome [Gammaproteobacteria bacterium]